MFSSSQVSKPTTHLSLSTNEYCEISWKTSKRGQDKKSWKTSKRGQDDFHHHHPVLRTVSGLQLARRHVKKQKILRSTVSVKSSEFFFLHQLVHSCSNRTIDVHHEPITVPNRGQTITTSSGKINSQALANVPSANQRAFVSKWTREMSWASDDSLTSESEADHNNIHSINETDINDAASVSSSTVCTSIDSVIQVEAIPPYPKQRPSDTLFDLRNQICHPTISDKTFNETINQTSTKTPAKTSAKPPTKSVCATFADDDFMYSPYEQIEVPSMTLSSTVTASSFTSSEEELNIGKLIAGKVRQAAAQSKAACEKLKRKLKHWGNISYDATIFQFCCFFTFLKLSFWFSLFLWMIWSIVTSVYFKFQVSSFKFKLIFQGFKTILLLVLTSIRYSFYFTSMDDVSRF